MQLRWTGCSKNNGFIAAFLKFLLNDRMKRIFCGAVPCIIGDFNIMEYNFKAIEKHWQQKWENAEAYKVYIDPSRPKYYVDMFPYP